MIDADCAWLPIDDLTTGDEEISTHILFVTEKEDDDDDDEGMFGLLVILLMDFSRRAIFPGQR